MASLKLFRSTGFPSLLPGSEARQSVHPSWIVLLASLWIGFACNVALWRDLAGSTSGGIAGIMHSIAIGIVVAACSSIALHLLAWYKTLKPAVTLLLVAAALAACSIWAQALPVDATLADRKLSTLLLPSWAVLLRWQATVLLVVLALVPAIWVWNTKVRKLPGQRQFNTNVMGVLASCAVMAAGAFLLSRGLF